MNPRACSSRSNVERQAFNRRTYSMPAPFGLYRPGLEVNFMQNSSAPTSPQLWHPALEVTQASYYRARYYDPGAGRFLAEDGLGNDEGLDVYIYVRNSPANFKDPSGFYKLVGFPPEKIGEMNNAIQNAINKLTADCPSCAGPDGKKIANALQGATFVYKRSLWSANGQVEECANARPISSRIIHVSSKAFGPKCCRLDSTIAHEATHKVTKSQDEWSPGGPMDVEDKCFGCH